MLPLVPDAMSCNIHHQERTLATYVPVSEFDLLFLEKAFMVGYVLISDVCDVRLRDTHAHSHFFGVGGIILRCWQISEPSVASLFLDLFIVCLGKDPGFLVHEIEGLLGAFIHLRPQFSELGLYACSKNCWP